MRTSRALFFALIVLGLAGCEESSGDFDARGNDIGLKTSSPWTIGGETATAALCEAADIETVQLVFVDDTADDLSGGTEYRFDEFSFPCAQAEYDSDGPVLEFGNYVARWGAVNFDGDEFQVSNRFEVDATRDPAVVNPPDWDPDGGGGDLGLKVNLDWDVDLSTTFASGACTDAVDATAISYALFDEADDATALTAETAVDCEDTLTFADVTFDAAKTYRLEVSGGPDADTIYWSAVCENLAPNTTGAAVTCEISDVRPKMTVTLQWDTDDLAGDDHFTAGTCDDSADLTHITYELKDGGDVVSSLEDVACTDEITFAAPEVEAGTDYDLTVIGGDVAASTTWNSTCTGLSAEDGEGSVFDCLIHRGDD